MTAPLFVPQIDPDRHPTLDRGGGVTHTELLVIGAGPYGLAAAAARANGVEPLVVGEPMEFWRRNMPAGMFPRSSLNWHLDPQGEHTLTAYLEATGVPARAVDPLPLELFIDYGDWFSRRQADFHTPRARARPTTRRRPV